MDFAGRSDAKGRWEGLEGGSWLCFLGLITVLASKKLREEVLLWFMVWHGQVNHIRDYHHGRTCCAWYILKLFSETPSPIILLDGSRDIYLHFCRSTYPSIHFGRLLRRNLQSHILMPTPFVHPLMRVPSTRNTSGDDRMWKRDTVRNAAVLQLHVASREEVAFFEDHRAGSAGAVVWSAVAGVDVDVRSLSAVEAGVG